MGKLHELAAVDNDMRGLYDKIKNEAAGTFKNRTDHFSGMQRTYQSEVQDDYDRDPEVKKLVTTVPAKLDYVEKQLTKVFDAQFQKEKTNCTAMSNIIVVEEDGTEVPVAENVPVVFLVQLEKKLVELRNQVYGSIPTLDPTKVWDWDGQNGYYVNKEPKKRVTRKKVVNHVKFEPTDKHPGQAELINVDETCGYYNQVNLSGMVTPKKKSDLLAKIDKLIHAVKTARARANDSETVDEKIAQKLFNYLGTQATLKE